MHAITESMRNKLRIEVSQRRLHGEALQCPSVACFAVCSLEAFSFRGFYASIPWMVAKSISDHRSEILSCFPNAKQTITSHGFKVVRKDFVHLQYLLALRLSCVVAAKLVRFRFRRNVGLVRELRSCHMCCSCVPVTNPVHTKKQHEAQNPS